MSKFQKEINRLLYKIKCEENSKKEELFNVTYNHLKVMAVKYAFNKNNWEDILFETYLRVFKYIDKFDFTKDGYNWLCKIVQNVAYDFNKKIQVHETLENAEREQPVFFDEDAVLDKSLLTDKLSKLTPYEQKIIYLRFWENLSYSEIAERTDGKKSTVHKQINSILKKLNKMLNKKS